jgi:hypothetical protein
MRATPSFTSRTSPTSSTFSSSLYCSISRSSTSLISLARSWVSVLDMSRSRQRFISMRHAAPVRSGTRAPAIPYYAPIGSAASTMRWRRDTRRRRSDPSMTRDRHSVPRYRRGVPDRPKCAGSRTPQNARQFGRHGLLRRLIGLVRECHLNVQPPQLLVEQLAVLGCDATDQPCRRFCSTTSTKFMNMGDT